ncbi:MAG: hypothetical protein ACWA6Y_07735 [Polaromonas sp.]
MFFSRCDDGCSKAYFLCERLSQPQRVSGRRLRWILDDLPESFQLLFFDLILLQAIDLA